MIELTERHTAANIAKTLDRKMLEIGMEKEKRLRILTDGAANIRAAFL